MPQIPGSQAVGVASPSGRAPFARRSGASPIGEALQGVGQVLGRIGEEKYQAATNLAVATAKNEYLRKSVELSNSVQEDPDYRSWQSNYEKASSDALEAIGANIQDKNAREMFRQDALTESTRVGVGLAGKARERFKGDKIAGLNLSFTANQKALSETDDPEARKSILQGTNQLYDAAVADGTIDANTAAQQKKLFVEGYAKTQADSLIPVARLDALQKGMKTDSQGRITFEKTGTFADFIAADDRLRMIKVAEVEQHQDVVAAEQAHRAQSEASYKKYVDQIITDPTKLDMKAVASDPYLSGEHGNSILRLHDEQLAKLQGKGDSEANKGPGFWNVFRAVTAPENDPNRIKDPLQIYNMAGNGRPLTLLGAQTLVGLVKSREATESKGDFETQKIAKFFTTMHDEIARPYGSAMPGGEESFFKFYMDKTRAIEAGKAAGKSIDDLLYSDSPAYIGKDYKNYQPKFDDETLAIQEPEQASASWWNFFGIGGGAEGKPFNTQTLDKNIRSGVDGSAQGIAALKAAIAGGHITKEAASRYALGRGWVNPTTAAKPSGPSVPAAR